MSGFRRGPFRKTDAALRLAERRRREDEAPRLKVEVPSLEKFDLEISEFKGVAGLTSTHVRRVVIAQAPVLFEIPCGDPSCKEGGHDLTHAVMRELRGYQSLFAGEDVCTGMVGSAPCGRVVRYVARAAYTT